MQQMLMIDEDMQFGGLILLDFLAELFEGSPKLSFSAEDVLSVLEATRSRPELFEPAVVEAYRQTMRAAGLAADSMPRFEKGAVS